MVMAVGEASNIDRLPIGRLSAHFLSRQTLEISSGCDLREVAND